MTDPVAHDRAGSRRQAQIQEGRAILADSTNYGQLGREDLEKALDKKGIKPSPSRSTTSRTST
jgi:hypothetical protein